MTGEGRAGRLAVTAVAPRPASAGRPVGEKNMTSLRRFWKEERGQDLIEYTLLMAFVALASAALFMGAGKSIKGVWTNGSAQLSSANTFGNPS